MFRDLGFFEALIEFRRNWTTAGGGGYGARWRGIRLDIPHVQCTLYVIKILTLEIPTATRKEMGWRI